MIEGADAQVDEVKLLEQKLAKDALFDAVKYDQKYFKLIKL